MLVLGLQVAAQNGKRVVRGVVLNTSDDSVVAIIEHVPNVDHNEATQAREARDAVASNLRAFEVTAAVVFEADYHPRAGLTDGTKSRLRLEGACLTACREIITTVEVMNGPKLGRACGGNKDDALGAAKDLGVDNKLVDAAAAALAAKSLI
ncbi:hypothetical protein [Nocardia brasiliensis]|uniref:hypothetical protein n=1 Tax=Nocardia brasiliensis TaxID=37326 RepID=UPI0018952696|nr:hypothetical protein [Nocardia brasiliensis]MBF6127842.1 hypothetical protein [Nocardia brasiliensis]